MKQLQDFKKKFDPKLKKFFQTEIKKIAQKDKFTAQILKQTQKITMSGGKRIRPALMLSGYLAYGGKKTVQILKISMAIELVHAMLLIQDDIIDQDDYRHNVLNIHKKFGLEYGVIVGDILFAWVTKIISSSQFDFKNLALEKIQNIVIDTVIGQNRDVQVVLEQKATEKDIMRIYEYKTAKYTLVGPFQVGAILAGAKQKELLQIEKALLPLGIAFQIQDDILGIFSDSEKIGKPVGSDIREGKQTILTVKCKDDLSQFLGNQKITKKEIKEFREIITKSGSLQYAQDLAQKNIKTGKDKIEKLKIKKDIKKFLLDIADYMLSREV